jgi:hypothetical protein
VTLRQRHDEVGFVVQEEDRLAYRRRRSCFGPGVRIIRCGRQGLLHHPFAGESGARGSRGSLRGRARRTRDSSGRDPRTSVFRSRRDGRGVAHDPRGSHRRRRRATGRGATGRRCRACVRRAPEATPVVRAGRPGRRRTQTADGTSRFGSPVPALAGKPWISPGGLLSIRMRLCGAIGRRLAASIATRPPMLQPQIETGAGSSVAASTSRSA